MLSCCLVSGFLSLPSFHPHQAHSSKFLHLWSLVLRKGLQSGSSCASQVVLCAVPALPLSWLQILGRQLVGNLRLKCSLRLAFSRLATCNMVLFMGRYF